MKNFKDMSTEEIKNLLPTIELMSKNNDNAKAMVKEIKKELKRRSK